MTTNVTERRLTAFEIKIWRMIYGPKLDTNTGMWKRKYKREIKGEEEMAPIKYYIKGQRTSGLAILFMEIIIT